MLAGGIDQVLSSVSNAVVVFAVARAGRAAEFGHAALMFSIVAAAIGIARGAIGTPLLLSGGQDPARIRRESRSAAAAAMTFGGAVAVVTVGASIAVHAPGLGLAFAVSAPLVLAQDALRFVGITLGEPQIALASDAVWTLGALALLGLTWLEPGRITAAALVWGWGAGALAALLLLCVALRLTPAWLGLIRWWRPGGRMRVRFALDSGLEQTTVIAVISISTIAAGPVAAAALRGAATLLGPFAILLSAFTLVAIPEASRAHATAPALWRRLRALTLPASVAALIIGIGCGFVPDRWGVLALGETWSHSAAVLPWLGVEYAALCWAGAAYNIFRYRRQTRGLVVGRAAQAVLTIVLCAGLGAIFHTPVAIAAALAATACVTAVLLLAVTARDRRSAPAQPIHALG
jgi:O-antigen/teichoic acid export membrane protein